MQVTPFGIGLIILGAGIGGVGGWLLFFKRPQPRKPGDSTAIPALTEPSRLALAAICLIAGYNLILWALPVGIAAVQLPRSKWYIWIPIGIALALLTLRLDKLDRDRASTDDSRRP